MLDQLVFALLVVVQPAATPRAQRLALDLASPGETRTERVADGKPFVVDLVNRVPGARYRLTAAGKSRLVEPLALGELADRWRTSAGCEAAFQALADVNAMTEERDVEGLFAFGGAADRIVRSRCPGSGEANQLISSGSMILGAATSAGLAEGTSFELVVERLRQGSEEPARTWRLRVEPQTLRVASPDLTEAAWLVEATARDILEMLLLGAGREPGKDVRFSLGRPQPGSSSFEVSVQGVGRSGSLTERLALDGGIWSPAVYSGWATALARRLGVTRSVQAPSEPVAGRLTHPVASVLEAENQRISSWLARDIRSPDAHEQAALLLSALALRESAGGFSDARLTLCRMSAHLAVARALRAGAPAGPDGALAEVAILALSKRQKDAVEALGRLHGEGPGQQAWARALRLTSTGDWRTLTGALTATLLERLEYCRALRDRLSGLHALEFVRSRNSEAIPDWGRIGLSEGFSVEEGNTYAPTALALELAEARQVYRLHQGRDLDPSAVGRALNAPPERCLSREGASAITPRVIDWGTWARFYQRHVLAAAVRQERALGQRLGPREAAGEARQQAQSMLVGLELLPLASLRGVERQLLERTCLDAAPLLEHSRHLLTASHWSSLNRTCDKTAIAPLLAGAETWFGGLAPAGTAFDFEERRFLLKPDDPAAFAALKHLAPYDRDIVRAWYRREAKPPSASGIESAYGVLLEYDIAAMKLRAALAAMDVDEYQRLYSHICELDADSCLDLGNYLASRNRPEAAETAFRRALDEGKGRVRISGQLDWLIDHYLEQRRTDDALAVAKKAAETGSAAGLKAMTRVLERLERWTEAERYLLRHLAAPVTVAERAERVPRVHLPAFYERFEQWLSKGGCRTQEPAALRGVFPSGTEPASLAEASGRPDDGVSISGPDRTLAGLGLESGDVIIALDGRRVRSPLQYRCVAEFAEGPSAKAIVWRPKLERYVEIATAPRRPLPQLNMRLWLRPGE